jgi:hypothetical protein
MQNEKQKLNKSLKQPLLRRGKYDKTKQAQNK